MYARRKLQQSHESAIKILDKSILSFFSARRNNEHRRKSQEMLKPFSDISFTLHSDIVQLTVRERKKSCIKPCNKTMTDNQNMNKT